MDFTVLADFLIFFKKNLVSHPVGQERKPKDERVGLEKKGEVFSVTKAK